jgi:hypothetical protein
LGGKSTARRLTAYLTRANRFLGSAQRGAREPANLKRARRELQVFEKQVQRAIARKRRPIDPALGGVILGLASGATSEISVVEASVR